MDFQEIVKNVSAEFLLEAQQSPQLLSDMAHMEYYMAESYSNRVLIELLQNADDAQASHFFVTFKNGNLYVANNGKPFDEHDLIAISRSGASKKERGVSIGYRGIGFKSTSAISDEIIIYSSNTAFTFSKSKCAQLLQAKEENVPTIRIPLFIEHLDAEIKNDIDSLQNEGYSTIFIFVNADIELILNEIKEIGPGYFLFLKCIEEYKILLNDHKENYYIKRDPVYGGMNITVKTRNDDKMWYVLEKDSVSLAFLLDNGVIVPCEKSDAVYHCYLPTLETAFISCKINADFSTDPSRKNIVLDEKSYRALDLIADLLLSICKNILCMSDLNKFKNFFSLLNKREKFSGINRALDDKFNQLVSGQNWITLNNGKMVSPVEYKMFPQVMDLPQGQLLRYPESVVSQQSINSKIYQNIDDIDDFLGEYSSSSFDMEDIIICMCDNQFVVNINEENYVQLFVQLFREVKVQCVLNYNANLTASLKNILVKTEEDEWHTIDNVVKENRKLNPYLKKEINERFTDSEKAWFSSSLGNILGYKNTSTISTIFRNNSEYNSTTSKTTYLENSKIYKWRSAEAKCIQIEQMLENQAEDVSVKNLGYDIYSVTKNGEKRYIEVKSVKSDFAFSLTNNEYTAAYEYGDEYFICLMYETEQKLIIKYIQNPLKNARFEKRVRQWDWICLDYLSNEITYDLS